MTIILTSLALLAYATPLPDVALADMRGGFRLPGGLDVAITVRTDTRIDGSLVLRTVYQLNEGPPSLRIYAPEKAADAGATEQRSAAAPATATSGNLNVTFDRQNGALFTNTMNPTPQIAVTGASANGLDDAPSGTAPVNAVPDGGAVAVPSGSLDVSTIASGQRIRLTGTDIEISHLVGNAIGSAVANSGNDRAIDTGTTLAIDIGGATAANLGSAMLRVEGLGLDATAGMLPR